MNDERVLGNGASAATQKIKRFPGARIFLTTCYNIHSNLFLRHFKTLDKKKSNKPF